MKFLKGRANVPITLGAVFLIDKKLVPNGLFDKTFKFSVRKDDNCYYFVKDYGEMYVESQNINESTALRLLPYYTDLTGGEVEFGLSATRVYTCTERMPPTNQTGLKALK